MSRTATYHTTVRWTGEHWGHLVMGNGPEMKFSAIFSMLSLRPHKGMGLSGTRTGTLGCSRPRTPLWRQRTRA